MRICAQDEVIFRQAFADLSVSEYMAWSEALLADFSKYGHAKDFRPQSISAFKTDRAQAPRVIHANFNGDVQAEDVSPEIFSDERTNYIQWSGAARLLCEKRYRLKEQARCESRSKTGLCQFNNHTIEIGAPIYVAHVIDLETGNNSEIWGCGECAEILSSHMFVK